MVRFEPFLERVSRVHQLHIRDIVDFLVAVSLWADVFHLFENLALAGLVDIHHDGSHALGIWHLLRVLSQQLDAYFEEVFVGQLHEFEVVASTPLFIVAQPDLLIEEVFEHHLIEPAGLDDAASVVVAEVLRHPQRHGDRFLRFEWTVFALLVRGLTAMRWITPPSEEKFGMMSMTRFSA